MHICHPHIVDVISASLEATNKVTLHYEVINYEGKVSVLEGTGIFMLDLNCRLLRPQYHFMDLQRAKFARSILHCDLVQVCPQDISPGAYHHSL